MIRRILSKTLGPATKARIRKILTKCRTLPYGFNLNKLGKIFDTDKVNGHYYGAHYQHHFRKYKFKKINLLEIGVGGYDSKEYGGHSLRMWKRYFVFGKIFSLDIFDKSKIQEKRIRIFQGSQVDPKFLEEVVRETGELDIIIDDGSHVNEHIIETFKLLFPKLKKGGIYVIEDVQTSYWPGYGGDSNDLKNPNTAMNFFKSFTDCLNHQEFIKPGYQPSYYDQHIVSISFYHNLIFIYKDTNDEKSNIIVDNNDNPKTTFKWG